MRVFASGFLQIPPHDGHPCRQLTVPTAKPVVDFHHQVVTHAGRTENADKACNQALSAFMLFYFKSMKQLRIDCYDDCTETHQNRTYSRTE